MCPISSIAKFYEDRKVLMVNAIKTHLKGTIWHSSSTRNLRWRNNLIRIDFLSSFARLDLRREIIAIDKAREDDFSPWDLVTFTEPTAGMFIWLQIPGIDDTRQLIYEKALGQEVLLLPGSAFFADQTKSYPFVRVSYSLCTPEQMEIVRQCMFDLVLNRFVWALLGYASFRASSPNRTESGHETVKKIEKRKIRLCRHSTIVLSMKNDINKVRQHASTLKNVCLLMKRDRTMPIACDEDKEKAPRGRFVHRRQYVNREDTSFFIWHKQCCLLSLEESLFIQVPRRWLIRQKRELKDCIDTSTSDSYGRVNVNRVTETSSAESKVTSRHWIRK